MGLRTTDTDPPKNLHDAILSLRRQGMGVRGPLETRTGIQICVVGGCIFKDTELVELLEKGELTAEGIKKLAERTNGNQFR
jgi:hypothetical protein